MCVLSEPHLCGVLSGDPCLQCVCLWGSIQGPGGDRSLRQPAPYSGRFLWSPQDTTQLSDWEGK
jgi:hypothetical protein